MGSPKVLSDLRSLLIYMLLVGILKHDRNSNYQETGCLSHVKVQT